MQQITNNENHLLEMSLQNNLENNNDNNIDNSTNITNISTDISTDISTNDSTDIITNISTNISTSDSTDIITNISTDISNITDSILNINISLCMARKNQKNSILVQCPNKRKFGDFCGKHKSYHQSKYMRIDEPIRKKKSKCIEEIPNLLSEKNLTKYSSDMIELKYKYYNEKLKDKFKEKLKAKLKSKTKHIYNYNIIPLSPIIPLDLLCLKDPLIENADLSPRIIKKSIIFYNLKRKKELASLDTIKMNNIMQHFINFYINCIVNIDKLIKIQRYSKKWILNHKIKTQGPATFNINLCHNTTDIYNLDDLKDLDRKYLFSYLDVDNFVYGFHIESFVEYLKQNKSNLNPYNRNPIPDYISERANNMWLSLDAKKEKSKMIQGHNYKDIRLRVKNKIITTFQKMDYFGYQTNLNWIYNLNINRLKILYRHLSVIWFYRANLTHEVRNRIVPNETLFTDYIHRQIMRQINKYSIIEYIIDIMNKMVSNGVSDSDKNQGCIIVLMALAEVSSECAASNSWLL